MAYLKANGFIALCFILTIGTFLSAGLQGCAAPKKTIPVTQTSYLESEWGVRLEMVRLTASGHLVDFRYRVLDPDKAVRLMHRGGEAYLIDQASGIQLKVPVTKVGQLRGTGNTPQAGRVYAVMFNSGGILKQGSLVTVVLGDFRAEDLTVQ